MLPFDGEQIWLVRQPREPVGEQALLELPAGKIDARARTCWARRKRELAEEIGKGAARVAPPRELLQLARPAVGGEPPVPGARTSTTRAREAEEEERIEIVRMPRRTSSTTTIAECKDAKTLIGLLWFERSCTGH